jgi:hypothetical protein
MPNARGRVWTGGACSPLPPSAPRRHQQCDERPDADLIGKPDDWAFLGRAPKSGGGYPVGASRSGARAVLNSASRPARWRQSLSKAAADELRRRRISIASQCRAGGHSPLGRHPLMKPRSWHYTAKLTSRSRFQRVAIGRASPRARRRGGTDHLPWRQPRLRLALHSPIADDARDRFSTVAAGTAP